MALRFYLPFKSLDLGPTDGEQYRVELWDADFVGTASEVTGTAEALRIEWEGESDLPGPILASSATYAILIEDVTGMVLVDALAGSAEGRFKMVIRRAGSTEVYWAGWVHADDCSYPDNYYPFHFEIFATDGIARLKDVDYADDLGDFFLGSQTVIQHLVRIVDKIGTTDVGTWPAARFRSTANWFANTMNTTTCPLHQAVVRHDRFEQLDQEGNNQPWSCFAVIDALLRPFGCQMLHAGGMFHIRQLGEYADDTQKAYYYDADGDLLSSATEDLDIGTDYLTDGAMKKTAGGQYTYNPPLKKIMVDYHHLTGNDRGQGQVWNTGDETWHTLPGAVIVDAADETYLRCSLTIRHKSNLVVIPPGSQPYPDHRLRFSVQIRLEDQTGPGNYYYLRRVQGAAVPFFDIQPSEMEWYFEGADTFTVWAAPINDFDNNVEKSMLLGFTTPSLPTEVNGSKIEMKIDLLGAEKPNGGDVVVDGVNIQGGITWYTQNVSLKVEEEGGGEAGNDTERTTATAAGDNTEIRGIDTYIGDGPAPFSLSAIRVGTTLTASWKIDNTGTGLPLAELLAKQSMRFRKFPQALYRGTFLHPEISPLSRFVDDDRAWMATRIALSAFENRWSGDFVLVDGDVDDISSSTSVPGPTPPHTPGDYPNPPQPPGTPAPDPNMPPFDGLAGGTLPGYVSTSEQSPATLTDGVVAADFNNTALSDDHELPITAVAYAFAKKGDVVAIVNPMTGHREGFTLRESYAPGATVLKLKTSESMTKNFPYGSFVKLSQRNAPRTAKGSYYERGVTGTGSGAKFWLVDDAELTLPSPADFDSKTLRERVRVVMGGTTLLYDANPYDDCFGLKPSTNEVEVYLGIPAGTTMYVEVS